MKNLVRVFLFAMIFLSAPSFAEAEDGTVSVISVETDCALLSAKLNKALIESERMHHEAVVIQRDAVHIYGLLGVLMVICLMLLAGFRGRGCKIEALKNEIITQRIELGSRIPREHTIPEAEDKK